MHEEFGITNGNLNTPCEAFKEALKESGLIQSLSGTEHCFDNAKMKSFFATPKKEKIYRIAAYTLTREEVKYFSTISKKGLS